MTAHKGHPLPASDEARHGEIPEHAERDKGLGDDAAPVNQPAGEAVTPEGESYPSGDLGRGQDSGDELERDQAEHQDRGQSIAAAQSRRD